MEGRNVPPDNTFASIHGVNPYFREYVWAPACMPSLVHCVGGFLWACVQQWGWHVHWEFGIPGQHTLPCLGTRRSSMAAAQPPLADVRLHAAPSADAQSR